MRRARRAFRSNGSIGGGRLIDRVAQIWHARKAFLVAGPRSAAVPVACDQKVA
jgi:hypothetical protein